MSRPSDFNEGVKTALYVTAAIAECIRTFRTIPSGQVYAHLMGRISLEHYQAIIALLIRAGLVREHPSHLLEWIGPDPSAPGQSQTNAEEPPQP